MRTRFTRATRAVVTTALTECRLRNDSLVGADHLLIALMHEPTLCSTYFRGKSPQQGRDAVRELDYRALRAAGVEVNQNTEGLPVPRTTKRRTELSAAAKSALEQAQRIASARKSKRVEERDVLLALVTRPSPNLALDVLDQLGLDASQIAGELAA